MEESGGSTNLLNLKPINSKDVGWLYAKYAPPGDNKERIQCDFCGNIYGSGIYRMKMHIGQIGGVVAKCKKADKEAIAKCRAAVLESKTKKHNKSTEEKQMRDEVNILDEDESLVTGGTSKRKKLGPIDEYVSKINVDADIPTRKTKQQTIKDHFARERWQQVASLCAHWVYESGIPFHAISSPSFSKLCEAIGQYGPGWFPPNQYQLREPLLKQDVEKTKLALKEHEDEWSKTGCSIMTDAWSDRKRRSIMNICIHSRLGTTFLMSTDTEGSSHTGEYICEMVDKVVVSTGIENVVQIVTDNASNNMAAARLLENKFPNIFWTSCSAHTVNLMLNGIGNLKKFKDVIVKAQSLVVFIYAHHSTLAMMRKCTNKRDIVRPGVTRFATAYLSLVSLMEKKEELRFMFVSDEWNDSRLAKCSRGKNATATVLSTPFWSGVQACINVFAPLVDLLRLVDSDRPSMGFVYGEFQVAIRRLNESFNGKILEQIMGVIEEKRKDKDTKKERIANALHLTGYFLNPYYYYKDPIIENEQAVMASVLECIKKFFPGDLRRQTWVANKELPIYRNKRGLFGNDMATNGCLIKDDDYDPVEWWGVFGSDTPNLKKMAQRILSLTSSSSGCERNWSCFEGIHTKKRNRLDSARLSNLVYVQFNAKLATQRIKTNKSKVDPLLGDPDDSTYVQEWVVKSSRGNEDEVEPISGIPWNVISEVTGADEITTNVVVSETETSKVREIVEDDFLSEEESDYELFDADDNDFFDD